MYPRPMAIRGLLLDLDGTIFVGNALLPGAREALASLAKRGIPVLFATNMTRRPRRVLLEKLRAMGLELRPEQIYTAPIAAAAWLRTQGMRRILPCMVPATLEDLSGFDFLDPRGPGRPSTPVADAVLVGDLGEAWSYAILNLAFRHLEAGAQLVAVQRNLYWQDEDGLSLDAGPFITALESAADVVATVVGKPSAQFFQGAAAILSLPLTEVAMVGDDIASDVGGAQRAGALGVLVRTGKFREHDLRCVVVPDAILDSIADLPEWLDARTD